MPDTIHSEQASIDVCGPNILRKGFVMRFLWILVWVVAVILGFFISGAFSQLAMITLAPPDAGVGFAALIGFLRFVAWVAFVWIVHRVFQAATQKTMPSQSRR